VFCKIVEGQIPAEKIYSDKGFLAFLDINPVNYGHCLVITKKHYPLMKDVPDEEISAAFNLCKKLMAKLKESLKADYVALSVVGVDVPHFHIHLIPRYFNDGMASFWPTKKYGEGDMKKVGERIRNNKD